MEKYGVVLDDAMKEKLAEETKERTCPSCGDKLDQVAPPHCPNCGTEPFEKRDSRSSKVKDA